MKTLLESILSTSKVGARAVLEKVFNDTVAWLKTCNLDRSFYYLDIKKNEIDLEPKGHDSYKLTIKRPCNKITFTGHPPYTYCEICNKNGKPLNIIYGFYSFDDDDIMSDVVKDRIVFSGCKINSEIKKLPKNCNYLIFESKPGIAGGQSHCKIINCIKDVKIEKLICKELAALDWRANNFRNITIKDECILSSLLYNTNNYFKYKEEYDKRGTNFQEELVTFIKNNHINTDKLYITDCSKFYVMFYKVIYDKPTETISFQEISKGLEFERLCKIIKNE